MERCPGFSPIFSDTLCGEVVHGDLAGAEQQVGELVRHNPVDLFRHPAIEASQARLNMSNGNMKLRCSEDAS